MSNEYTVSAPANIAFIKYWGATDLERAIPCNASISMTLRECVSRTTVRVLAPGAPDEVWHATDGGMTAADGVFRDRALAHLERLRGWAETDRGLAMATRNSFPAAAGIASSASGFAALTVAALGALGVEATTQELSVLARRSGSGSAARQLAPASHWDLRDVVVLVQIGPKGVSSLDGHRRATSSPHYERRQALIPDRLAAVRAAIEARDLERLGPVIEEDAIELHLIAMSSKPAIFYWRPATLRVLEAVRRMRHCGIEAWSTMDAGANVHVICTPQAEAEVAAELEQLDGVHGVIRDGVGNGPEPIRGSLFEESRS